MSNKDNCKKHYGGVKTVFICGVDNLGNPDGNWEKIDLTKFDKRNGSLSRWFKLKLK